jgi:hypothetical protein
MALDEDVWGHMQFETSCSTFEKFSQAVSNEMQAWATEYPQN